MQIKQQLIYIKDYIRGCYARFLFDHKPSQYQKDITNISSIVINRTDGKLGDSICLLPFFKAIKESNPSIKIIIISNESMFSFFKDSSLVDYVIKCSKRPKKKEIKNIANQISDCDVYIHIIKNLIYRDLCFISLLKPKFVATIDERLKLDDFKLFLQVEPFAEKGCHFRELLNNILLQLSVSETIINNDYVKPYIGDSKANKSDTIAFNPYGASRRRRLSDNVIKAIIDYLLLRTSYKIEFIVSPKEREYVSSLINKYFNNSNNVKLAEETKTIKDLILAISSYKGLIGMDTGTAHVASAYNIPQLTFYLNDMPNYNRWYSMSKVAKHYIHNTQDFDSLNFNDIQKDLDIYIKSLNP